METGFYLSHPLIVNPESGLISNILYLMYVSFNERLKMIFTACDYSLFDRLSTTYCSKSKYFRVHLHHIPSSRIFLFLIFTQGAHNEIKKVHIIRLHFFNDADTNKTLRKLEMQCSEMILTSIELQSSAL